MFDITKNDQDAFDHFSSEKLVYENGEYDFTFDHKYLIYHAPVGKQIRYYALDMETRLSSEVCRRKYGKYYDYESLVPAILFSIKYTGDRRYLKVMTNSPAGTIDNFFRIILPSYGYTIREEQIRLCKQMYIGLTGRQASINEAEVGTGKSIAYIVASLCAKTGYQNKYGIQQPVTITTSSIELQKALMEKEIPSLSKILVDCGFISEPLTAVLRKGKEHYFCRMRYNDYTDQIRTHRKKAEAVPELLFAETFANHALDLDKYKLPLSVKDRICVKGKCQSCQYADECRYNKFIKDAMDTEHHWDFQITNHNLYLNSARQSGILLPSTFVIVDEAHKLKDAAQDCYYTRISEKDIPNYVAWTNVKCASKESIRQHHDLQSALMVENKMLFDMLRKQVPNEDGKEPGSDIELNSGIISILRRLVRDIEAVDALNVKKAQPGEISGKDLCRSVLRFLEDSEMNIWLEADENDEISFCCGPIDMGKELYRDVWRIAGSHVFTSGTMNDGQNFDHFKREIGLSNISDSLILESSVSSPFNYADHTRLYVPDDMPFPDNDSSSYIQAVADRIVRLVNAANGHTAILFTSYKLLHAVHQLTKDRLGKYDVICMTRSNKTVIDKFKASDNAVLFASGSMWEGVDCSGDTLSSVIIVRLPFPRRSAAMQQKQKTYDSVSDFVHDYAVPEMLIKLRQGAGRLVRSETDTGVISILDSRASTCGNYHDCVCKALEKYPQVHSVDEVADFIRSVKAPEYFSEG